MNLRRLADLKASEAQIRKSISDFGFAPEHTFESFIDSVEDGWRGTYFISEEGWGVMVYFIEKDSEWITLTDPVAPQEKRSEILSAFLREVLLKDKAETAYIQCVSEVRKGMLALVKPELTVRRTSEKMYWPVVDLATYDPELASPKMKPLRNARNRFSREHNLEIKDPNMLSKDTLHAIVELWKKNRPARHRTYVAEYHTLIDEDFRGTEDAIALVVDGVPEAISAGWRIPNSDGFYHSLALHTYRHWGLGEVMMLESLKRMKAGGYAFANLGGSDANLLSFKKKFADTDFYTSEYFSVVRT